MRRTRVYLLFLVFSGAIAQQAPPAFEVASVKPTTFDPRKDRPGFETEPGALTARAVDLGLCIEWAFDLKPYQISGPGWLGSQRFEISAKAAGPASTDVLKRMMQTLLADRFKLAFHREKKDLEVYVLLQGKNPPRLPKSKEGAESNVRFSGPTVTFTKISLAQIAEMLGRQMDRPVLDMTGLEGDYELAIDVSSTSDDDAAAELPPAARAKMTLARNLAPIIQDQVGLKLEGRKVPTEIMVIDHLEKAPVEN